MAKLVINFRINCKQKKTKTNVKDDLGDDIEKMVKYTRGLVQYAKSLKDFTDIMREIENEQRETLQINKLIQNTDILDFLKPETDKSNQSNFETENKSSKNVNNISIWKENNEEKT